MFERLYASGWHNPGLFWLVGAGFFVWLLRARPFLRSFLLLFTLEILADAWQSGTLASPLVAAAGLATPVAIAFVILGDHRYFLLVERYASIEGEPSKAALAGLGPCAHLAGRARIRAGRAHRVRPSCTRWPCRSTSPTRAAPSCSTRRCSSCSPSHCASACCRGASPMRASPFAAGSYGVTSFVAVQYALWATADVVILATGGDGGFLLRIVPNVLYYAAFLPFVAATAPREAWAE
jgi:hypothetical protein